MLPSSEICRRAHLARDARFDGRFVVGVVTTGVFCRPICPARTPRAENARYFASAPAALAAGYRPCRRCRPEAAPRREPGGVGGETLHRALALLDAGFLDDHGVVALAAKLGVGTRHLRRLFATELGVSPAAFARSRRLLLARRLLDESTLPVTDVAMTAGFGSVRRFNDAFRTTFGQNPAAARRQRRPSSAGVTLRLRLRMPYHGAWTFAFLRGRTVPGIERATGTSYQRQVAPHGCVRIACEAGGLRIAIPAAAVAQAGDVLARARRLFDVDADAAAIDGHLAAAPTLAAQVAAAPGVRVPGVWDAFEGAVRAVLGQQVSVARATALAGALCERFGAGAFPTPAVLAKADVAAIGIPGMRAGAIAEVARRVASEGDGWLARPDALRAGFARIRGIGPWTAEYAAMRVARDPDAFPDGDWGVVKALGMKGAAARRWAEPLRPWRAYACMRLWFSTTHAVTGP